MVEKHKWTDSFGREFESEIVARFDRGEFEWVTCWVDHADEFRTFVAGPKQLKGVEAYETLTEEQQRAVFEMALDEADDMSSRDRAFEIIDELSLSDMQEWLSVAEEEE